jgi:hypothetical protein
MVKAFAAVEEFEGNLAAREMGPALQKVIALKPGIVGLDVQLQSDAAFTVEVNVSVPPDEFTVVFAAPAYEAKKVPSKSTAQVTHVEVLVFIKFRNSLQ